VIQVSQDTPHEGLKVVQFGTNALVHHRVVYFPVKVHQEVAETSQFPHRAGQVVGEDVGLVEYFERVLVVGRRPELAGCNDMVGEADTTLSRSTI
jgi:hypothetical protein